MILKYKIINVNFTKTLSPRQKNFSKQSSSNTTRSKTTTYLEYRDLGRILDSLDPGRHWGLGRTKLLVEAADKTQSWDPAAVGNTVVVVAEIMRLLRLKINS